MEVPVNSRQRLWFAIAVVFATTWVACTQSDAPSALEPAFAPAGIPGPPASELRTASFGGSSLTLWPYTGSDFSATASDPVNLLFLGQADPRLLRAAFLMLDGDRTAFGLPNQFPFNCTWIDPIDPTPQTTYVEPDGWIGSTIQVECGDFNSLRFHIRLFGAGEWTIGASHFEARIPGTPGHNVLSWELAEALAVLDLVRSGLLNPATDVGATGIITQVPTFSTTLKDIYNAVPPLWPFLGTPGPVSADVPIPNDGRATILRLADVAGATAGVIRRDYLLQFDQVIPKPFCVAGAPSPALYVSGPVRFEQMLNLTPSGNFISQFHATGRLELTPVDPSTGQPVGDTYEARVREHYRTIMTDGATLVSNVSLQIELPPGGPGRGRLMVTVRLGPGASDVASMDLRCDP
jgi:hypothetical protein